MLASRAALTVSCCFVLAAPAAEVPALRIAAGTTLVRTLHTKSELTLDEILLAMNGEAVEGDFLDAVEMSLVHEERQVVRDTYESVADAQPTRVKRTFEELSGNDHNLFKNEEGEERDDAELESALERKSVVFHRAHPEAEWETAFAEGEEGDEALLDALDPDMDLAAFLPPQGVEEGDAWSVEPRVFAMLLEPGGDVGLVDPQAAEDEEEDPSADQELRENLTGSIRATYRGARQQDGGRVAVIELAIEVRTHTEGALAAAAAPARASGTDRAEPAFTLAGELRWDLEHGHALALELEGESQLILTQTLVGEFEGERLEQTQSMAFRGPYSFQLAVERP